MYTSHPYVTVIMIQMLKKNIFINMYNPHKRRLECWTTEPILFVYQKILSNSL